MLPEYIGAKLKNIKIYSRIVFINQNATPPAQVNEPAASYLEGGGLFAGEFQRSSGSPISEELDLTLASSIIDERVGRIDNRGARSVQV